MAASPTSPQSPHDWEKDEEGLTEARAEQLLQEFGRNEIPEKVTPWYVMLIRQFIGPMPLMIAAAALLSLVIACLDPANGPWPDFAICTFMLLLNAILGFREQLHANAAAQALKEKTLPEVSVKRDGVNKPLDARLLVPGDVVFLRAGQKCPADCDWLSGDPMEVDNAALNGETRLDKVNAGKRLVWSSAQICKGGGSYLVVRETGLNTMIGQAAKAMQEGGPGKGEFQRTIEKLVKCVITVALTMVCVLLGVQLGVRDRDPLETLLACVSLLIGSVPVALPVVLTVTLALGSSRMAEEGAIVTNLTSLQEIAVMKILCSDKTGTLTTAKMSVYHDRIWQATPEYNPDMILTFAGLSSNDANIDDPIDSGVLRVCKSTFASHKETWEDKRRRYITKRFVGFDPVTKRVCCFVHDTKENKYYLIGKGLLNKVLETGQDGGAECWTCDHLGTVGPKAKEEDRKLAKDAFKTISVCVQEGDGFEQVQTSDGMVIKLRTDRPMRFVGIVPMRDPPREDTKPTIANIRYAGVEVKMITGDHLDIAIKTAEQINLGAEIYPRQNLFDSAGNRLDDFIYKADGFAQVVPKDKFEVIKSLQDRGFTVGMTGDGVNDAAALSVANVGIAVAGAVDAARAASDIILTEGGLSPIYSAIYESRCIFQRLRSYVIYRIAHSIHVVCVLSILVLGFDYTLDPLYVILMALFNDLAITMIGYDEAIPTKGPSVPRVSTMLVLAAGTGVCQTASSILLFAFGHHFPLQDDTGATGVAPKHFGDHGYQDSSGNGDDYIGTCLYLQMATTAGLLMFSTRTRRLICAGNPPNWRLVVSIVLAFILTLFMTGFKTIHVKISWKDIGIIWAYNICWALVIELVKMAIIFIMPEDITDRQCCGDAAEVMAKGGRVIGESDEATAPLLGQHGIQEDRGDRSVHAVHRQGSLGSRRGSAVLSGLTGGILGTGEAIRDSLAHRRGEEEHGRVHSPQHRIHRDSSQRAH
eukprot:TRINITY_DN1552_c0_g1_i6.p1 TRINITY_DN1552_c0_g1~~TRINITY_DN1552_c0_g1_i6.p1  ORF type:complete len:1024 (+),score=427.19 TRINITY_DN1552_c0_g1_i6:121-3072(+)